MKAHLCCFVFCWGLLTQAFSYQITLFPAAEVYDPNPAVLDEKVGFPSQHLLVEAFEAEALLPELRSNLPGHRATDGDVSLSAWDGEWPSSAAAEEASFSILRSGVRAFGIGIANNSGATNDQVIVNSGTPISLGDRPGHTTNAQGRAFYLKIQAEPSDPDLRNVRILTGGCKPRFDHLVLELDASAPSAASVPGLVPTPVENSGVTNSAEKGEPPAVRARPEPAVPAPVNRAETLPPAPSWSKGVALLSNAGRQYIGDQLRFFFVDPDGAITAPKGQWLSLYHTEGKPFRLHGEVRLGGPSSSLLFPNDLPDGFALFVREWDSLQRYALTSRGADVKRRMLEGKPNDGIVSVTRFDEPQVGKWIPFFLEANWDRIVFYFGDQAAFIDGPLEVDGANKIAISPGTKLRELRIEIFELP